MIKRQFLYQAVVFDSLLISYSKKRLELNEDDLWTLSIHSAFRIAYVKITRSPTAI